MFCPVDGIGRRPAAGRRRSLPGRDSAPARAKEPAARFPVHLCFVSKYNSEQSPFPYPSALHFAILCGRSVCCLPKSLPSPVRQGTELRQTPSCGSRAPRFCGRAARASAGHAAARSTRRTERRLAPARALRRKRPLPLREHTLPPPSQGWQGRWVARVAGRQKVATPSGSRGGKICSGSLIC